MSTLKLSLLGPPQITLDSVPVNLKRRKGMALLAYLAVTGETQRRDFLATMFWPDSSQSSARGALRRDLSHLKKALGEGWLTIERETVTLPHQADLWLDVEYFHYLTEIESHNHSANETNRADLDILAKAVGLYRDDFLTGFTVPGCPQFDEWQSFQTESLRQSLGVVLERLVRGYIAQGQIDQALLHARQWLVFDPLHEPAHRYLMQLYAQTDQQSAALRQYQLCVQTFDTELGSAPTPETTALYERIRAGELSLNTVAESINGTNIDAVLSMGHFPFAKSDGDDGPDIDRPTVVAREDELAQLDRFLDLALEGQGRVVFVTGEAGTGKTTLLQEFAWRAQARQVDLIVAKGNCDAYTGTGNPYLPFYEILGLLTGDIAARLAAGAISHEHGQRLWRLAPQAIQTLVTNGPDLMGIFVSNSSLIERARATMGQTPDGADPWLARLEQLVARYESGQNMGSLNQINLFEQYAKVLETLAQYHPLLLVLDDLHWADTGSINLLFHLGRRLEGHRILIVGIYRRVDMALGRPPTTLGAAGPGSGQVERHPLETVINELQSHFGNIQVNLLEAGGKALVEAILDMEPNCLGPAFREALYQHTRGHALFTVEIVRGMKLRGDLIQDENGCWVEGPAIHWDQLPARVEGVIGERIGRLPAPLQEILKVASVEGEEFTAEVVAQVQDMDPREIVRQLSSELDKQHLLVRSRGSKRLAGQRLSRYRFRHILFQSYLYHSLDEVEQIYLHEAVGAVLEQLYEKHPGRGAVQLARHFQAAGLTSKAVNYLQQAGEKAERSYASQEAVKFFNKALLLLQKLSSTPARIQQELTLQLGLGHTIKATKGHAAPAMEQAFSRARTLAQQTGATPQLLSALRGLHQYSTTRAEHHTALALAQEFYDLTQKGTPDPAQMMMAHRMLGISLYRLAKFEQARSHFEQSLAWRDPQQHRFLSLHYGQDDPAVGALNYLSLTLWYLGYPDQALMRRQEALTLAEKLSQPLTLTETLQFGAILYSLRREARAAQTQAEAVIDFSTKQAFPFWLAMGMLRRGWALTEQGQGEEGIAQMREGLAASREIGLEAGRTFYLAMLAEAYRKTGQIDQGLTTLTEALRQVDKFGERLYEAELYRIKGELLLKVEGRRRKAESTPEACFEQALKIAREQQAKSLELRATLSLARLWQTQGKTAEARDQLAQIYGWFSEGFGTVDLQEAKTFLEALV